MQLSRRHFLKASRGCLALPLMECFGLEPDGQSPQRFLAINYTLGLYGPSFFPDDSGQSKYLDLLESRRRDFTVISGLSHPEVGGGHASEPCFLTAATGPGRQGFRNTQSMDRLMAEMRGSHTRFPSLQVGLVSRADTTGLSYDRGGIPLPIYSNPADLFARMFSQEKPAEVERKLSRIAKGGSVLDDLGVEARKMGQNLSPHDKAVLDDFFTALRTVEKELEQSGKWLQKEKPKTTEKPPPNIVADVTQHVELNFRMLHLALKSDSSRYLTFHNPGWVNGKPKIKGVEEGHHALSHHGKAPEKIAQLEAIEIAQVKALNQFLNTLNEDKEGAKSLLDSTTILVGSNLGNASNHDTRNLPIILAGGGYKHQPKLSFNSNDNTPLCQLYLSIFDHMGFEVEEFGGQKKRLSGIV